MITKALQHARKNLVAYLALFIALGGTSYAAVNLPAGSVGSKQLRNHSISPIKFDPQFINGNVHAWVVASADGTVTASAGKPTVFVAGGNQGFYNVTWKVPTSGRLKCFAIGGLTTASGQASVDAFLGFEHTKPPKKAWGVDVHTYGAQGQPLAQGFYAALVC